MYNDLNVTLTTSAGLSICLDNSVEIGAELSRSTGAFQELQDVVLAAHEKASGTQPDVTGSLTSEGKYKIDFGIPLSGGGGGSHAETADRLTTSRLIGLTGEASGEIAFNGTQDVYIPAIINRMTNTDIENIFQEDDD